jgi:hypothetical protein
MGELQFMRPVEADASWFDALDHLVNRYGAVVVITLIGFPVERDELVKAVERHGLGCTLEQGRIYIHSAKD